MGDLRTDIIGDWIRANYHRWGNTPAERVARLAACQDDTGATRHYISARICRMERTGDIPAPGSIPQASAPNNPSMDAAMSAAPGVINEDALRSEIDVHYKALRFLQAIQPGEFYRIDDAAVAAGIPRTVSRAVFADARYAAYRGQAVANQQTYLGHPDRIAAMKQEAILR